MAWPEARILSDYHSLEAWKPRGETVICVVWKGLHSLKCLIHMEGQFPQLSPGSIAVVLQRGNRGVL